jgi:hypothetical protein
MASSIAKSLSPNHCCVKCIRSITSIGIGDRTRAPEGACGVISLTSAAHDTTRFISSRKSCLRVRLLDVFSPSSACFVVNIIAQVC